MTDQQAIKDCLSGNTHAYRHLVESYEEMAIKTAYRFLRDWDEARDASQEAFIRAYQALESFRAGSKFSTWFYRILVNLCTDRVRSSRFRKSVPLPVRPLTSGNPGPDAILEYRDLMEKALNQLPIKRRQVFILMDLEGRRGKEVAKILNINESTVRVHRMKAKEQLRKIIVKLI
ncbi:sigma-70 family RNA polymerase sigma factor [candidate division KSB1 bacterium]|nr:sigma-70 family RNA polymerase sigma factor [candidate division KSB1 bacterium]